MAETPPFDFGDYVTIEQKRYGVPNEIYLYKVVAGRRQSNVWREVPVQAGDKQKIHDRIEDVLLCICCGVDETVVERFRVADVKPARRRSAP
jgi:hypothetical protein